MTTESAKIGEIQYMNSEQNSKNGGYTPLTIAAQRQQKSQAGPRFLGQQNQLVNNRIHFEGELSG
jgi:hypothetical protein